MFDYNMDYKRRDQILFGDACPPEEKWAGGIKGFSISPSVLKQLIDEQFVDPRDRQNDAPSAQAFCDFFDVVSSQDEWRVNGYAVSHDREDYRVSIEGCSTESHLELKDLIAFAIRFRLADVFELSPSGAYCWYD